MAGDPHFYSNRTVIARNIQIHLSGLQQHLLQSVAYLLFTETNPLAKKSHITLIMTPVPDGARGNHFRNKKQDTLHRNNISRVISLPPHLYAGLAKWTFNDPITLHGLFLEICNYDKSLSK